MDVQRDSPTLPLPPEALVLPPLPTYPLENIPVTSGVTPASQALPSVLPSPTLPIPVDRFEQLSVGPERTEVSPRSSPRGQPPKFYPDREQQFPPGEDVSPPELLTDEDLSIRDAASALGHPLASPPPITPPPPQEQPGPAPTTTLPQPPAMTEADPYLLPPMDMGFEPQLPAAYMFKRLGENLEGVIMGCTDETKKECLEGLVFGLPARHWEYLQHVKTGKTFYLFNYSTRTLHGIFRSVDSAQWKLNRHGWSPAPHVETPFPAQIRVERVDVFPPLFENEYRPILDSKNNYIMRAWLSSVKLNKYSCRGTQKFSFELDDEQVKALDALFVNTKAIDPDRQEPPAIVRMYRPRYEVSYGPPRYGPRRFRGGWGRGGMGNGWRPRNQPFRGGYPGRGRSPGRSPARGRRPPMGTTHPLARSSLSGPTPNGPPVRPPPGMGLSEPPPPPGMGSMPPPGMGTMPPPGIGSTLPPGIGTQDSGHDRSNVRPSSASALPVEQTSTPLPDRPSTSHLPPPMTAPPSGVPGQM